MTPEKQILLNHLVKYSYTVDEANPFLLSSGVSSTEYIDCKKGLSLPRAMAALGKVFYDLMPEKAIAIGGLTMGSDPIAMATSCWSAFQDKQVSWFSVRKAIKDHGKTKMIEGTYPEKGKGEVVLVDDVVTSGGSIISAIQAAYQADMQISKVIVLIDREQPNGMKNIKDRVYGYVPVESIFKLSEIREAHKAYNERIYNKSS